MKGWLKGMQVEYERIEKRLIEIKGPEPVWKWMTPNPITIQASQTLKEAVLLLQVRRIDGLPVVDEEGKNPRASDQIPYFDQFYERDFS